MANEDALEELAAAVGNGGQIAATSKIGVYVCTHRLLYGSSGGLLHGIQGKLLYDCDVPPGTTTYE